MGSVTSALNKSKNTVVQLSKDPTTDREWSGRPGKGRNRRTSDDMAKGFPHAAWERADPGIVEPGELSVVLNTAQPNEDTAPSNSPPFCSSASTNCKSPFL